MDTSLTDIVGDMPESVIKTKVIQAKVTECKGDSSFTITNGETTVDLDVDNGQFAKRLEVGNTYSLYNVEKVSPVKLKLRKKGSFVKQLFIATDPSVDGQCETYTRLRDLMRITDEKKNIPNKKVIVKVFEKKDVETTRNGLNLRYL